MPKTFLTAEWRKLIMAQYEVAPETLLPYLPPGVELDLFHGKCFISLVAFWFCRTRVLGIAFPFHMQFEEVNLRFYVRRVEAVGTVKRGVVFVSEIVPRPAIALIARSLYEEPYTTMPTRHRLIEPHVVSGKPATLEIAYAWKHRRRWSSCQVRAEAEPVAIEAASVQEFITEHYFGYTRRTRGATSEYAVGHPRWLHYPVREYRIDADFGALYGDRFAGLDPSRPDNVLLAEGSPITVSSGKRLIP